MYYLCCEQWVDNKERNFSGCCLSAIRTKDGGGDDEKSPCLLLLLFGLMFQLSLSLSRTNPLIRRLRPSSHSNPIPCMLASTRDMTRKKVRIFTISHLNLILSLSLSSTHTRTDVFAFICIAYFWRRERGARREREVESKFLWDTHVNNSEPYQQHHHHHHQDLERCWTVIFFYPFIHPLPLVGVTMRQGGWHESGLSNCLSPALISRTHYIIFSPSLALALLPPRSACIFCCFFSFSSFETIKSNPHSTHTHTLCRRGDIFSKREERGHNCMFIYSQLMIISRFVVL
jgi:hypothetical protein